MKFIRYGSLAPQYHGNGSCPVKNGIYAFPRGFVEFFFLGGIGAGSIKNGRFRYLRDRKGNKILVTVKDFYEPVGGTRILRRAAPEDIFPDFEIIKEPFLYILQRKRLTWKDVVLYAEDERGVYCGITTDYLSEKRYPIAIRNKPTFFDYSGYIWHHLDEFDDVILCKPEHIIKSTGRWVLTDIKSYEKALKKYIGLEKYWRHRSFKLGGSYTGFPTSEIDKDPLEVFIEHV